MRYCWKFGTVEAFQVKSDEPSRAWPVWLLVAAARGVYKPKAGRWAGTFRVEGSEIELKPGSWIVYVGDDSYVALGEEIFKRLFEPAPVVEVS